MLGLIGTSKVYHLDKRPATKVKVNKWLAGMCPLGALVATADSSVSGVASVPHLGWKRSVGGP